MLRATAVVLLAAGALVTSGCGGGSAGTDATDSSTSASAATSASPSVSAASPSESASASPTAAEDSAKEIAITVADGKVTPATHREKIAKGDTVRLTVTSDQAEEVHVHGYDLTKDLDPGTPGSIEFTADQSGVFEVELERSALQLVQLQVQ